jgi:hypothetical protein
MIAAYALGVPLPAARKLGTNVNFSDWFTAQSRQPDDCRPRKRHDGDEGKAVGCVPPTALLSLGGSAIWVAKKYLRGRNNPSTLSLIVTRRVKPPSPSPSIHSASNPGCSSGWGSFF